MNSQLSLSQDEWELLLELLERERAELPVEIRHTRHCEVRDQLHYREHLVDELLDRMRTPARII